MNNKILNSMNRKYYYYDYEKYKMIKLKWLERYMPSLIGLFFAFSSLFISFGINKSLSDRLSEADSIQMKNDYLIKREDSLKNVIALINETENFSESELIMMLNGLNVMYPEVVLAQSNLETANYTSDIFKTAGNLFGMKPARIRPYTHYGIYKDHANYLGNWRLSVIDYALWQSREASKSNVKSVEDYLTLLRVKGYAEDDEYISKLRELINK